MIREAIQKLTAGESLGREESRATVNEILEGKVQDAAIAGLLIALKMKGETPEEITGFAEGLRDMAVRIKPVAEHLVDTCGTGGDRKDTFNISTAAAFLAAGAGVTVAKHGNRGVSSKCGSADVLDELGVDIHMDARRVRECIDRVGIGFLFAQTFHPAMKRVMGVRKSLGVPTIFNILGPLSNPAGARAQVLGVNRKELAPVMGEVLSRLGTGKSFVVHGLDGMDEFSLVAETLVCEVEGGSLRQYVLSPEDLGIARCGLKDLAGGDAGRNASILMEIFSSVEGPRLDISIANAAFAIVAGGRAKSMDEGVELARESAFKGEALKKLDDLVAFSKVGRENSVS